jgi:acyl-coenzyme A thioesterase 9
MLWSEAILASLKPHSVPPDANASLPASYPLVARHMHDSYSELVLPFASNKQLFEEYTNASGGIRTGKLMEHLDSLAGSIGYKHLLGPAVEKLGSIEQRGFYIVTASVDRYVLQMILIKFKLYKLSQWRLDMLAPLNPVRDLRLSGQVIYTGRSSMEVAVRMEAMGNNDSEETIMLGMEFQPTPVCLRQLFRFRSVLYGLQRCNHPSREGGQLPYYIYA